MPRIIVTATAAEGLARCRNFLGAKNFQAAKRAAQVIQYRFKALETDPNIGKPLFELPELRELIIEFGDSGYVALYRHDPTVNHVYVLAFRHQKEAGY